MKKASTIPFYHSVAEVSDFTTLSNEAPIDKVSKYNVDKTLVLPSAFALLSSETLSVPTLHYLNGPGSVKGSAVI